MNAVQVMRDRAQKAGNLKSTSQENVSNQGQTIVIEPADPEVVYVPEYDPWLVYGEPIGIWPGWYSYPGLCPSRGRSNCVWASGLGSDFFWRIRLGLAQLGIRLAPPGNHLQPQHLHIPQQNFRQSQQLQSRRRISWSQRISWRRSERIRRWPAWICGATRTVWYSFRRIQRL